MNKTIPSSLYKYQSVKNFNNLDKDRSIQNLFKRQIVFSSPKNFNDPFDSKIELIPPSLQEIKNLRKKVPSKYKDEIHSFYHEGNWTKKFTSFSKKIEQMFNKLIDDDRILCLSAIGDNNLMWGHYSNSHKGFVIEFDSQYMQGIEKVEYIHEIPTLKLINYIELYYTLKKEVGKEIMEALRCKLKDWSYEEEYRIILSNKTRYGLLVSEKKNCSIIKYPDKPIVKSVIFGCRMPQEVRQYIVDNIPYQVNFKEIIELKSSLNIIDYEIKK